MTTNIKHIYERSICVFLMLLLYVIFPVITSGRRAPLPETDTAARRQRALAMEQLVSCQSLDSANFAILIKEISTGKTLASYNPSKGLIPASIMKSLTTATLLRHLNPDWRFKTDVYISGSHKNNVLEGNVIVVGSGDPGVNSRCEPKSTDLVREIVEKLQEKKIDSIAGKILVDNSYFEGPSTPPSWAKGDLSCSYGTGSHAFNFENNSRGKSAVSNPDVVFTDRLRTALCEARIKYGANPIESTRREKLLTHVSAPLEDLMRSCMMRSDNLFAETFLRTYSAEQHGDGSTADGAQRETKYWKKRRKPMDDVTIIDGSGLSRSNRLTAEFLSSVLIEMADDVEYASFFPLAGQEGTLRNFLKGTDLDSYIAMKTGSMSGIQCYAGYLLDEDFAPTHTIVVMANRLRDRGGFRTALGAALQKIF